MPVSTHSLEKDGSHDNVGGTHHRHKRRKGPSKQSKIVATTTSQINHDNQLLDAVQQGKTRVVKRLLDSRANPNHTNEYGQTPLMLACTIPDEEVRKSILEILLRRGADVNLQDIRGKTVLMSAVQLEDEDTTLTLLAHKCDVKLVDSDGNNALFFAATRGNEELVRKLVKISKHQRGDIDQQNVQGVTPLLIACQEGHLEVAHILVAGGASPTIRDLDQFMNAQEWMRLTGFYSEDKLAFLSPSTQKRTYYRKQRQIKGIRTLDECVMSHDQEGSVSPNVFSMKRKSSDEASSHLPGLVVDRQSHRHHQRRDSLSVPKSMFGSVSGGKSMFAMPPVSMATKTPGYALGCPVPTKPSSQSQSTFQTSKGDLYSSSYLTRRKSFLSKNPRSGLYHSGALEPMDDFDRGQRSIENGHRPPSEKSGSHSNKKGVLPPIKR